MTPPRPDPTPQDGAKTDPKQTRNGPKQAETEPKRNEMDLKWTRNQALWGGTGGVGLGVGGGGRGVVREKKITSLGELCLDQKRRLMRFEICEKRYESNFACSTKMLS